jgi:hypothetical protein
VTYDHQEKTSKLDNKKVRIESTCPKKGVLNKNNKTKKILLKEPNLKEEKHMKNKDKIKT